MANVALPDIGKAFTASQTALDLVAVGYSLGLAASVFFLFPRKDNEQRLLGEYHQADSTQAKASPAARVRGQSSPAG